MARRAARRHFVHHREAPDADVRRHFIGRRGHELPIAHEDPGASLERIERLGEGDVRTEGMRAVFEGGDDAEVATAAAERPEQIRVLGFAGAQNSPVGGHHLAREEVVDRHAVRPPVPR